jgi:hypothetical protein
MFRAERYLFTQACSLEADFNDGSEANQWAAVGDLGGKAEVLGNCSVNGGAFSIYPWYRLRKSGFHYRMDFSDAIKDFGQANQFSQTTLCGGPFGANSTYCTTVLRQELSRRGKNW